MRHGPHHAAQKSTITGTSLCSTSRSNDASVTSKPWDTVVLLSLAGAATEQRRQSATDDNAPPRRLFPRAVRPNRPPVAASAGRLHAQDVARLELQRALGRHLVAIQQVAPGPARLAARGARRR